MKYIVDTNVVLNNPEVLELYDVVIPSTVLREIENLELKKNNPQLQYELRNAKRILYKLTEDMNGHIIDIKDDNESLEGYSASYADNVIIAKARKEGLGILTNDILMIMKAKAEDIECISPAFKKRDNTGYEGLSDFYLNDKKDPDNNAEILLSAIEENIGKQGKHSEIFKTDYEFQENQYIIFWDKSKPIVHEKTNKFKGWKATNIFKYDGENMIRVNSNKIKSQLETITPRNVRQRCAIDMLQDDKTKIKALFGTFGAGKDYLMLGQALSMVKDPSCPIDKIVWVRNNVEVKDSNPIGFLPNGVEDKLMPFLMPLVDHLGGDASLLEEMLAEGQVEVQHLGFIRGRDIKNAIIYVTEVQSNTLEHIQLLIGRVGEGSQIWLNGDDKQTDSRKFEFNNGVRALKKLAGEPLYAQVTLDKTERSEVARLSAKLDEN